jgi:thiosulfate/3-mercaptopyruvate sulfurtransferase
VGGLLVHPDELGARLAEPALVLIDARPAAAYVAGLIPGAAHLDLFGASLRDTSPAPLAAFEWMMAHLLELRGVTRERRVIVYDEDSGMRAARVLWLLHLFGHPAARLLDGGMRRWRAEGRPLAREARDPEPATFVVERRPEHLATAADVRAALTRPEVVIVDTRSRAEYTGELVRAARGGAVPGAVHLEWTRNLDAEGRFLAPGELRRMYAAAGVAPEREVITYCHGGYRAAQSWVALKLAGYPRVRNYLGSWNEWGNRPDLPIARPGT